MKLQDMGRLSDYGGVEGAYDLTLHVHTALVSCVPHRHPPVVENGHGRWSLRPGLWPLRGTPMILCVCHLREFKVAIPGLELASWLCVIHMAEQAAPCVQIPDLVAASD